MWRFLNSTVKCTVIIRKSKFPLYFTPLRLRCPAAVRHVFGPFGARLFAAGQGFLPLFLNLGYLYATKTVQIINLPLCNTNLKP